MTSITEWSHSILSAAQDAAAEVRRVSIDALEAGDYDTTAAYLSLWEKARSYAARAAAPEFYILLRRVWPIFDAGHDGFEFVPYLLWRDVFTVFRAGHEFLAIARSGHIIACKK